METHTTNLSISSNERIFQIISEAQAELARIKPEIEYLEQCQLKLRDLKTQESKLQSIIISLNSISDAQDKNVNNTSVQTKETITNNAVTSNNNVTEENTNNRQIHNNKVDTHVKKVFMPDKAISEVKAVLRAKNNLNYEIFKAIVFNSGKGTTQQIKTYLVENNIKQPKTGKGFEDVELKEISSRANYLVRKSILISTESGKFESLYGWQELDNWKNS